MPLEIIIGDILEKPVDAIVVSAAPIDGKLSGFSHRLYSEAGYDQLMEERRKLGSLSDGKSAVTSGYNLKTKYIIHTFVRSWKNNTKGEAGILSDCYYSALKCAAEIGAGTVAFPILGAGRNRFPLDIARRIAENTIEDFLSKTHSPMLVFLVITPDAATGLSKQYGEYKLSDEERLAAYESKYLSELKASGLSADEYDRNRVDYYLNKYITNQSKAAVEIDWDKGLLSRFRSGITRTPERNRVISLAIYMNLNEEERMEFIRCVGYKYPESEMDHIIEKLLNSGCTDFKTLCDELHKIDDSYDLTGRNKKNAVKEK